MPRFVRPPEPADPELFASLVASWWGYCERWAARQERAGPGRDFGPAANMALWKAAATFDPGRGVRFRTLLGWHLRSARQIATRRRPSAAGPIREEPAVPPRLPDGSPDFDGLIAGLPAADRALLRLRFAEGLSEAEAGRRLGGDRDWARRRVRRSLAALRQTTTA